MDVNNIKATDGDTDPCVTTISGEGVYAEDNIDFVSLMLFSVSSSRSADLIISSSNPICNK